MNFNDQNCRTNSNQELAPKLGQNQEPNIALPTENGVATLNDKRKEEGAYLSTIWRRISTQEDTIKLAMEAADCD